MAQFSLWVGNLHHGIDLPSLRNYFIRAGNVKDIYIPKNQISKQRLYGFVRFSSAEEAREVAKHCNGDFIWGRDLIVRPATRERNEAFLSKVEAVSKQTYSAYTTPVHKNEIQEVCPKDFASLEYNSKEGDRKWLEGCAVGYLSHACDINEIQKELRKQSIQCSLIFMGGKMVLLSFLGEALMREAINVHKDWFNIFFDFIKPWELHDIPKSRYVWMKCANVPLHAWNLDFFDLIGNLYGTCIATDPDTELKKRFDFGRILVLTSVPQTIRRNHRVKIDSKIFEISIMEDESQPFNPQRDMHFIEKAKATETLWEGESHRNGKSVASGKETVSPLSQNSNLGGYNIPISNFKIVLDIDEGQIPQPDPNNNLAHSHITPISSQCTVPESPLDQPIHDQPINIIPPPLTNQNFDADATLNLIGAIGENQENEAEEDISVEVDYNEDRMVLRRSDKKDKKMARGKFLSGGCKILKKELANQAKKSKRGKKAARKLSALEVEEASDSQPAEAIIRTREEEIHSIATNAWRLGQKLGMTASHEGDDVLGLISGIVERNWDEFEQQQNE